MENWISIKEAADIKGCTSANIHYYIKQGKVEAIKEGSRWRVNPESLNFEIRSSKSFDGFELLKDQLTEKDKQLAEKDKQIALLQEQLGQAQQLVAMEKQERLQLLTRPCQIFCVNSLPTTS